MSPRKRPRFPLPDGPLTLTASPFLYANMGTTRRCVRFVCMDALPPSVNQLTSMIPMERAKHAKFWRSQFAVVAADALQHSHALTPPVAIVATYFWGSARRRDIMNYSPKWAVDGIVDSGLIPDDNSDVVAEYTTRFMRDILHQRLEIIAKEIAATDWVVMR